MRNKYIKITVSIIALLLISSQFLLSIFSASEGSHWYIMRNGNKQPKLPKEAEIIEKYNCYYLDKRVTDESAEKIIYLTFDAGYENGNVEKILNVLREKEVPAAFFLLDNIIIKNTDLVLRMANEGHLVCNHTKRHKDLSASSFNEIKNDLLSLEKIYNDYTGLQMSKYFRFPEGKYSENALKAVDELGYKTIFWSFGYADWDNQKQPDADVSIKKIIENTHNGEVILLHPTSETNAKILGTLIDNWRGMGYKFGTLDQLCN